MRPGNVSIRDDAPPLLSRLRHGIISHGTRPDPPSESRSLRDGGHRRPIPFSAEANFVVAEGRHVLPKDLPNAVKHLSDEELDRLLVVTLAEAKRRGRHTTPTKKRPADGLRQLLMKETPPFRGISSTTRSVSCLAW